jgi:hypothetical protein
VASNGGAFLQGVFGTSTHTMSTLWKLLVEHDLVPNEGTITHLMGMLHFFKAYPEQGHECSTVGGSSGAIDPKTLRKYIWPFIFLAADLELVVVISFSTFVSFNEINSHNILPD